MDKRDPKFDDKILRGGKKIQETLKIHILNRKQNKPPHRLLIVMLDAHHLWVEQTH